MLVEYLLILYDLVISGIDSYKMVMIIGSRKNSVLIMLMIVRLCGESLLDRMLMWICLFFCRV